MEKLIELLNEYRPAEENCSYELYDKWVDIKKQTPQIWYVENTYAEGSVRENQTLYFISKRGGFIKRLVDNDKIEFRKLLDDHNFCEIRALNRGIVSCLIMLLAIQDSPIEFLLSIIK